MNKISKIEQKQSTLLNQNRLMQFAQYTTRPEHYSSIPTFKEVLESLRKHYGLRSK